MKGRRDLSRAIVLTICVILPLSLAEVRDYEPFGLHLASDGKRVPLSKFDVEVDENQSPESFPAMTRPLPVDGPRIATVAMLPGSCPRRSGQADAGSFSLSPDEPGPGSSTVLRI